MLGGPPQRLCVDCYRQGSKKTEQHLEPHFWYRTSSAKSRRRDRVTSSQE
jgi:hypothetical protein